MITKQLCINELQKLYNKHGKVTEKILRQYGDVSYDSVKRLFGSMQKACEEANIPIKQGQRKMVEKDEILIEIYRLIKTYGYISKPIMEKHSTYSPKIVQRIFGSFSNMYKELELKRHASGVVPTDEELINELHRLYRHHEFISYDVIDKYSIYSSTCFKDRASKNGWSGIKYYRQIVGCKEVNLEWGESPSARFAISKFSKYLNEEPIKEKTFDWLINKDTGMNLRIDAYYPNNNIAIEYNGPQHYVIDGRYTKTEDELRHRKDLDFLKKKLIEANGIKLIVIHYKDKVDEEYIKTVLAK